MAKLIYPKLDVEKTIAMLKSRRVIGVDKDGVLVDPAEVLYQNRLRGFKSAGLEFCYSSSTNYMLGGVGEQYNGGTRPIIALIAFDRYFERHRSSTMDKEGAFRQLLALPDASAKLDDVIYKYVKPQDVETAKRIYWWDGGEFFNAASTAEYVKPYPGAREALLGLVDIYRGNAAVITNMHSLQAVVRDLRACGFSENELEKLIVIENARKPSTEGFDRALGALNSRSGIEIVKRDIVYVGDSIIDLRTAKNAGAASVAVLSGMGRQDHLAKEKPDAIAQDICKLHDALRD